MNGDFGGPGFGPVGHRAADGVGHAQSSERGFHRRADHIDNPSPARALHARKDGLGQVLVVDQVLVERGKKGVFLRFRDGAASGAAAVVHQDVHVSGCEHFGCGPHDVGRILKVGHCHGMPLSGQRGQGGLKAFKVACEQGHLRTESRELLCSGETNALGGAAHQGAFAAQIQRQNMLFTHAAKGR